MIQKKKDNLLRTIRDVWSLILGFRRYAKKNITRIKIAWKV